MFRMAMQAPVHQQQKCMVSGGDYVDKQCFVGENLIHQIAFILLFAMYITWK